MADEAQWERLRERSARRFGEGSIFGEGYLEAGIVFVGEAPGEQEVEQGRPFVGRAGKLLDELLEEAAIERSQTYVTNLVKLRPTKEEAGRVSNRPPRAGEVREGLEVLQEEVGLLDPRMLVLLGGSPAKALLGKSFKLTSGRGEVLDSSLGVPALATYHPAYLLRQRGEDFDRIRKTIVEDLATARNRAASGPGT